MSKQRTIESFFVPKPGAVQISKETKEPTKRKREDCDTETQGPIRKRLRKMSESSSCFDTDIFNGENETAESLELGEIKAELQLETKLEQISGCEERSSAETKPDTKKQPTPKSTKEAIKESTETCKKKATTVKLLPSEHEEDDEKTIQGDNKGRESDDEIENEEIDVKAIALQSNSKTEHAIERWEQGSPVPYAALAKTFQEISKTRSRLEQIQIMRIFFKEVIELTPADLVNSVYLATNQIAAPHKGIELGVGESLIQKAIAEATGKLPKDVKAEYNNLGDLGLVAQASKGKVRSLVKSKPLTLRRVRESLLEIAKESGKDSQKRRTDKIRSLLVQSQDFEALFIVKALQGKMRINLGPKTIQAAVAHAFVYYKHKKPSPELLADATLQLEQAYNQLPDWEKIIPVLLESGIERISDKIHLTIGIPFAPMLAQPTKGVDEIFERFKGKTFTAEWKYDGERTQIHGLADGTIVVYSRNLDNTTEKFPDIVEDINLALSETTKTFILDCEAVAFDREANKILPFQILSTRSKKSVKKEDIKVQVCLFAFDIMYLNGESLIKEPFSKRRSVLYESFKEIPGFFRFAVHKNLSEPEEITSFLQEAVEGNCEGLMLKTLDVDAMYQAAKRSYQWLKVKKDYLQGMGDTLDLVPIGAWVGKGKRTGVYGGFLLACFDDDYENYQAICKIGSGFTDAQLQEFTELLKKTQIDKPKSYFQYGDVKNVMPDVWFEPSVVWEVKAADLSISPVHQAAVGLVHATKGIALRFPRLVRVRTDKGVEQATTAEQVAEMFRNQKQNHAFTQDPED